eukprot:2646896-Pleurochrysis_carterae.AAC.1
MHYLRTNRSRFSTNKTTSRENDFKLADATRLGVSFAHSWMYFTGLSSEEQWDVGASRQTTSSKARVHAKNQRKLVRARSHVLSSGTTWVCISCVYFLLPINIIEHHISPANMAKLQQHADSV